MKEFIKKYKNLILVIIAGIIIYYAVMHSSDITYIKNCYNPQKIKSWVQSFGKLSVFAFIFLQIIQVVIFFIPGEAIQTVGGYVYGIFYGTILSIVGILIGSLITFFIARKFGNSILEKILPDKNYLNIKKIIDKSGNKYILLILYLIPGFPKDILGYAAGITKISTKNFILYSTIARIPGIVMSSFIGSNLYSRDYTTVIVAIAVAAVIFIIGTLKGKNIINYFSKKKYEAKYNH